MNKKTILIVGDVIAFIILNIIGFATHGEVGSSFLPRMAVAFFPIVFAWFVLAPWFGLLDEAVITNPRNLLRIPLVFLFAAPLAVILRGALLNAPALPIFALVFGSTNAFGMLVWRWLYQVFMKKNA
ncbi:MAG TPA: DUF3054 domain-containing protein, partial [Anaerolineales bacterium]|nr:DUF3054 domain-containing protein [Anaerolineales bacterium]